MRVLLAAQNYAPIIGGEERHVQGLARQLALQGHDVHVATQALVGASPDSEQHDGITIHRLRSLSTRLPMLHADPNRPHALPFPDPLLTQELNSLLERIDPHLVHAHNWIVNSLLPIQRRRRRPLVMSLHGYEHRCATTRYLYAGSICSGPGAAKCIRCSTSVYGAAKGMPMLAATWVVKPWRERLIDRFLPVSTAVARGAGIVARGLPMEIVPNFIPDALLNAADRKSRRPDRLPKGDYLLFVGDLTSDKGVTTLLAAYGGLPSPKPKLLLVGRQSPEVRADLADDVILAAEWPHDLVVEGFLHAIAAVLPSEWADPCPTTVLEAMALGTPLVTTSVGGIVDIVDEDSAIVTPPANQRALSQAIARLLRDHALRAKLSASARARVRHFTASAIAARIETIYGDLLAARGVPATS